MPVRMAGKILQPRRLPEAALSLVGRACLPGRMGALCQLIAATTIRTGLRARSQLDTGKYPKGIKVGKQEQ
jgi:hypothetical protein